MFRIVVRRWTKVVSKRAKKKKIFEIEGFTSERVFLRCNEPFERRVLKMRTFLLTYELVSQLEV